MLRLPLAPTLGLVLDGRYLLGLKNFAPDPGSSKFRQMKFMVGVNFGF